MYFLVRWLCIGIVRSFFKDVAVLHPERIPLYGPAIFVGNHNNQFMDASMLVANIPRQVHFLVALKSMKRRVIGFLSRLAGCIPVDRQDDRATKGQGAARISHHFTEEDHVCPSPPHHHHHQRGRRAPEAVPPDRSDEEDKRGAPPQPQKRAEVSGLATEPSAAEPDAEARPEGGGGKAAGEAGTTEAPRGDSGEPLSRSLSPTAYPRHPVMPRQASLPALMLQASTPGGGGATSPSPPRSGTAPFEAKNGVKPPSLAGLQLLSILGSHTRFLADVRPGYKIRLDGKDYLVLKVLSDTHLVVHPPQDETPRRGLDRSDTGAEAKPPRRADGPQAASLEDSGVLSGEGLRRRRATAEPDGREEGQRGEGLAAGRQEADRAGKGPEAEGEHRAVNGKHDRVVAASYKEYKGGSHDRTTLLPLKAGVAIMAIQGVAAGAEDVMIVPVGLIYHNPHKTQSRATIHIGEPIPISRELAIEYQQDRRAATARILTDVEQGLRSCIITAQDHETMTLIHLCCSLYPPERLRLSPEMRFNLNQLLSKLFWRCADEPELSALRHDLAQYQGSLQRAGIPDHDVWMLKQSTSGASLCFAEKLIALLFSICLGVPLLPLWGPLRVIAYFLAERHRAQALAASRVKVRGMDVVASYKVIVLLVCVPLFNLLYGAIFGVVFGLTIAETLVAMVLCVCLLPIAYYFSMRHAEKILPLIRQMRTLIIVVIGKVNIWRENERELITQRMELQFSLRETLMTLGPRTSPTFMDGLYSIVPKVVLHADMKRLLRRKEDFAPLQMKRLMNNAEEIL
ncbi:glycerol-3-phosphate-acyltransferase [Besnoitia besnoiti]|uniref:Glycerol-3-phosphate-acyltransferase n=1 Tax=Besnoitia besnoiti TaxID=94643 RepID=A0A2A9MB51_BESBE|nr:glycerol-3-phosphate-acyltransferase [Besnoitia besnoiti]PFH33531.1 glycerol-3-phosphate-acyltransferase [Besnoitia besnoiti]